MSEFFIPYWDAYLIGATPFLILLAWLLPTPQSKVIALAVVMIVVVSIFTTMEWLRWPLMNDIEYGRTTIGGPGLYDGRQPSLFDRFIIMGIISVFLWGLIDILSIPVRGIIGFVKKRLPA